MCGDLENLLSSVPSFHPWNLPLAWPLFFCSGIRLYRSIQEHKAGADHQEKRCFCGKLHAGGRLNPTEQPLRDLALGAVLGASCLVGAGSVVRMVALVCGLANSSQHHPGSDLSLHISVTAVLSRELFGNRGCTGVLSLLSLSLGAGHGLHSEDRWKDDE